VGRSGLRKEGWKLAKEWEDSGLTCDLLFRIDSFGHSHNISRGGKVWERGSQGVSRS
jgi:hypothetical protein